MSKHVLLGHTDGRASYWSVSCGHNSSKKNLRSWLVPETYVEMRMLFILVINPNTELTILCKTNKLVGRELWSAVMVKITVCFINRNVVTAV